MKTVRSKSICLSTKVVMMSLWPSYHIHDQIVAGSENPIYLKLMLRLTLTVSFAKLSRSSSELFFDYREIGYILLASLIMTEILFERLIIFKATRPNPFSAFATSEKTVKTSHVRKQVHNCFYQIHIKMKIIKVICTEKWIKCLRA